MLKNLADHDVDIFLFRFVVRDDVIHCCINETIWADMYVDIDVLLASFVENCSQILHKYKQYFPNEMLLDGCILMDGCLELMLSKGMGEYFTMADKDTLFSNAKAIAELLMEVMERRGSLFPPTSDTLM